MEKTLFSRKDLMERWGVSYQSIVNYENNGILTRNPKFDNPMYYLEEIDSKLSLISFSLTTSSFCLFKISI